MRERRLSVKQKRKKIQYSPDSQIRCFGGNSNKPHILWLMYHKRKLMSWINSLTFIYFFSLLVTLIKAKIMHFFHVVLFKITRWDFFISTFILIKIKNYYFGLKLLLVTQALCIYWALTSLQGKVSKSHLIELRLMFFREESRQFILI